MRYTYHEGKIPNPKPFIEGMDNLFLIFLNKKDLFNIFWETAFKILDYQGLKSLVTFSKV